MTQMTEQQASQRSVFKEEMQARTEEMSVIREELHRARRETRMVQLKGNRDLQWRMAQHHALEQLVESEKKMRAVLVIFENGLIAHAYADQAAEEEEVKQGVESLAHSCSGFSKGEVDQLLRTLELPISIGKTTRNTQESEEICE